MLPTTDPYERDDEPEHDDEPDCRPSPLLGLFLRACASDWIGEDGKGGRMAGGMDISALAQQALADIFERIEGMGASARVACRGASYTASLPPPVARAEVAAALNYVESLVEYGRAQLGYLADAPYRLNQLVTFGDGRQGTYVGATMAGRLRIQLVRRLDDDSSDPLFVEIDPAMLKMDSRGSKDAPV